MNSDYVLFAQAMLDRKWHSYGPAPAAFSVLCYEQGDFTIALINNFYAGAAKRNPGDPPNVDIGARIAITRAAELMCKTLFRRQG